MTIMNTWATTVIFLVYMGILIIADIEIDQYDAISYT